MLNFKEWLNENEDIDLDKLLHQTKDWKPSPRSVLAGRFNDPDTIFLNGKNKMAFIFTNGKLYLGKFQNDSHAAINLRHKKIRDSDFMLRGRIGTLYGIKIVAFWESGKYEIFDACLKSLEQNGLIDKNTYISIPGQDAIPIRDFKSTKAITPEEQAKVDLYRKLHLMRGDVKKDAMQKLGLVGDQKKHPWQQEMEKRKLITPGSKFWAPTSESL